MKKMFAFLKQFRLALITTLVIILVMEVPGLLRMQEIGLGAEWLAFHFSADRLPRYLTFVATTFVCVHIIVMCMRRFRQLIAYDKKLEEEGEE